MNEGKRKIGEYTVLCSVNVGEKEVILASKEQSTNGDKFMCGFAERNDLFELCSECMVSDDYIEIVHLFGSRVANEAELFKEQVEKLDIPISLITEADCIPDHYSKDINGKIIAANGLFRFMGRFDCCVKTLKRQKRIFMEKERDLSKEEYIRLVQTSQKKGKLRLSLVLQTICATGIRISELQFITVEAVKSGYADVNCKGMYVYFQSAFSE